MNSASTRRTASAARAMAQEVTGTTPCARIKSSETRPRTVPGAARYSMYGASGGAPGHLYAGLQDSAVWHTADHGDTWAQLPVGLGGVWFSLVVLGSKGCS